jgi:hypothetical protein
MTTNPSPPGATGAGPAPLPATVAAGLGVWFVLAAAVGATGRLESLPRPALQGIIAVLTIAALAACRVGPRLREWSMTGDIRWLIGLHTLRLAAALAFFWYYRQGELPWAFAVPGGIGDAAVALLAAAVMFHPRRVPVLLWNALGLLDILGVVVTAARCGIADPASMAPLARLPLSILPTFLVPLIIASHVLIFVRLLRPGAR